MARRKQDNDYEVVHVLTTVDGGSDNLVDLIEIDGFSLPEFREQFGANQEKDPFMYDRYSVGPDDVPFLEKKLGVQLQLNFQRFAYFIEAARKDV